MRVVIVLGLALAAMLSGCASQRTLSDHEIQRIHTVKVVYIRSPYELGMRSFVSNNIMPMPIPGGVLFVPGSIYDRGDLTSKYLGPYQDVIKTFDARERLYTAVTQAVSQTPWLAKAPFEVIDHPMSGDDKWHYAQDSGLDAIVYLTPVVALDDSAYHVHVKLYVDVYVNPHNASVYEYDSAMFGDMLELQIKQNPNEVHHSLSALSADKAVARWFADDAVQLHSDIDLLLPPLGPELAHYLGGDVPTKGQ